MEHNTLNIIKTVAIALTSTVAIITFIKGYLEYNLSSKQKRFELYTEYRKRMKEDNSIYEIIDYLDNDNDKLKDVPRLKRFYFLGFYENIALLMNSRLIKPEIAYYMFGYYSLKCWENDLFWIGIERESHYWRVFREFVKKMEKLEKKETQIPLNESIKYII